MKVNGIMNDSASSRFMKENTVDEAAVRHLFSAVQGNQSRALRFYK
jgi:hypothetical protein